MRRTLFALALAAAAVAVGAAQPAENTFPGRNGLIVFTSHGNSEGLAAINTMHTDGTRLVRLAYGTGAVWSADGRWLLFSRKDGIFRMNAHGGGIRKVARGGYEWLSYSLSPEGTRFAGANYSDGIDIVTLGDGKNYNSVPMAADNGAGDSSKWSPAWSPDGKTIAYLDGFSGSEGGNARIRLYDVASGRRRGLGGVATNGLSWSPDGRRLLYGSLAGVRVIDVATKRIRLLAEGGEGARWSPDGRRIVFVRDRDIYTMRSDGSEQKRILRNPGLYATPDWQALR
jgi:Tol biopolymer transport system component